MSMSERGGKRKGSGRPKAEITKMMRIPVSLVEGIKSIVEAHKSGLEVNFESCIQQSESDYLDDFQETLQENQIAEFELKLLPRHERRRIQRLGSKGVLKVVSDPKLN